MRNFLTVKSSAVCSTDLDLLREFKQDGCEPDKNLLPAALRRRASLTTRMAITAAHRACAAAAVDAKHLPSIFASVGGEIQVTDELCRTLPDNNALLSPTQFHNSVHNTTSGYWTILQGCQAPSTAIAALDDTFAIALLEAAAQLQQMPGDLLLVCYDETWPQYMAPPMGKIPLACALVVSNIPPAAGSPMLSLPEIATSVETLDATLSELIHEAPAAAVFPLLTALHEKRYPRYVPLNNGETRWFTRLTAF